jgi:ferredoxin-NADP reductase
VPLMAMVRHRAAARAQVPFVLLYSCRTPDDAIYRAELDQMGAADGALRVVYTFTRSAPQGWTGYTRRIDPAMLREVSDPLGGNAQAYVCGPTLLVEAAADALVTLGWQAAMVRTERFGPTGGPS